MGGIEITVPEGIEVRMDVFALMGGQSGPRTPAPPGSPVLRVRGVALMGGVEVTRGKAQRGIGPGGGPGHRQLDH
jgi:hypothetical protein